MPMKKKQIPEHQKKRIQEISLFIKNWRQNESLSQLEFSKRANVHFNSVYNLEKMKESSLITLLNCIDAMEGMTLSEFFAGME
jgi:transcriptional regulator with XRE-family HTH domain